MTTTPTQWLEEAVLTIPLHDTRVFSQLWEDGRLRRAGSGAKPDAIDAASGRLAASTIEQRRSLLIVFPEGGSDRGAVLFAGTLVTEWWNRQKTHVAPGRVLYVGTTVGIREHLSRVRVQRLALAEVFPQTHTSGRQASRRSRASPPTQGLPEVICAYSPADPVALVDEYQPAWIAIDCGDAEHIRWLPPLLRRAREKCIAVIAWSENPISQVVQEFAQHDGEVIRWPFRRDLATTTINPVIVEDESPRLDQRLLEAYRLLARASGDRGRGRLASDAVQLSWRLHRSLEQLAVPVEIFESEADHYWGVQRLEKLVSGSREFANVIASSGDPLGDLLARVLALHEEALEALRRSEPPLWCALREICIEEAKPDRSRVIIFPSEARRRIFALGLLARFNVSEEDLAEVGTFLTSLTEYPKRAREIPDPGTSSPAAGLGRSRQDDQSLLLATVPSAASSTKMLPLLLTPGFGVLMLPYQVPILARRVGEWSAAMELQPAEVETVVRARFGTVPPRPDLPEYRAVAVGESRRGIQIRTARPAPTRTRAPDLSLDEIDELRWLMSDDDDRSGASADYDLLHDQEESVWTREAIEVRFSDGWKGLFASEDQLNVVGAISSQQIDERYVRSLRRGDRVLYIHGQRRQSLYDLVISRVHRHPAIEIHLALISRWRRELTQSFQKRQADGLTVDALLNQLQSRGSSIETAQAVRFWLNGSTIAPSDAEDLLRLADLLEMPFVRQYYKRIDRAAARIRGLHRGLSNRLNQWLRDQAQGGGEASIEVFDGELGLSFEDFRDSLTILTVEAVQPVIGPFLSRSLGVLERDQEP